MAESMSRKEDEMSKMYISRTEKIIPTILQIHVYMVNTMKKKSLFHLLREPVKCMTLLPDHCIYGFRVVLMYVSVCTRTLSHVSTSLCPLLSRADKKAMNQNDKGTCLYIETNEP